MASILIHLAIAKELEDKLKIKNKYDYYLGSIAPDIGKHIGKSKKDTHFLNYTRNSIPSIIQFTKKYKDFKNNSFDLGYYVHLYTDKVWFEDFIESRSFNNTVRLLDGVIYQTATADDILKLIYQDYSNVTNFLYDRYNLDMEIFNTDFKQPISNINEIPLEKLNLLIEGSRKYINRCVTTKLPKVFDEIDIENFILDTSKEILEDLKNY